MHLQKGSELERAGQDLSTYFVEQVKQIFNMDVAIVGHDRGGSPPFVTLDGMPHSPLPRLNTPTDEEVGIVRVVKKEGIQKDDDNNEAEGSFANVMEESRKILAENPPIKGKII